MVDVDKNRERMSVPSRENERLSVDREIGLEKNHEQQSERLPTAEREEEEERGILQRILRRKSDDDGVTDAQAPERMEVVKKIESYLEEGLGDEYTALDSARRREFKQKGEATAAAIADLVFRAKISFRKIFALIHGWLALLPGINKLFLEQESKIRADRVVQYAKDRKK